MNNSRSFGELPAFTKPSLKVSTSQDWYKKIKKNKSVKELPTLENSTASSGFPAM
jgi:hypothetical protein